jgi:hypothetical protein
MLKPIRWEIVAQIGQKTPFLVEPAWVEGVRSKMVSFTAKNCFRDRVPTSET